MKVIHNPEVIDLVPYKDMLILERNAQVALTDSGGAQEEAFILGVPCVTLSNETEWVETVESGWDKLVGADTERILEATQVFLRNGASEANMVPYGDGHAAERIVKLCVCGAI